MKNLVFKLSCLTYLPSSWQNEKKSDLALRRMAAERNVGRTLVWAKCIWGLFKNFEDRTGERYSKFCLIRILWGTYSTCKPFYIHQLFDKMKNRVNNPFCQRRQ